MSKSGKSGKAVNDGKINNVMGNRLEADFIASNPRLGAGMFWLNQNVPKIGLVAWQLLCIMLNKMIGFEGTPLEVNEKNIKQGGDWIVADYMQWIGRWVPTNLKALVDGDNKPTDENLATIEKEWTLYDRRSHGVVVGSGRGMIGAMHLSRTSAYNMHILVPYKVKGLERTGLYIVAQFSYDEYVRRCLAGKNPKWCRYQKGYDIALEKVGMGKDPSKYGHLRRVLNEKTKLRNKGKLPQLEIRCFSESFQSLYPYREWVTPPQVWEYKGGVFRPRPDQTVDVPMVDWNGKLHPTTPHYGPVQED